MKKSFLSCVIAAAMFGNSLLVSAYDELVIQAVNNGNPASGLTIKLDGEEEKTSNNNGIAVFDLSAGAHSIQIIQNGTTIHSFRFDTANGQLTDINVSIGQDSDPRVSIESYFKTETAADKARAVTGGIEGRVSSNGFPVPDAVVSVVGTDIQAYTDETGAYELTLPRGIYSLEISHPDFGESTVNNYRVISNVVKGSNFSISQAQEIEEVTVIAKVNVSAFQESERYSLNVIDTMGIEQLARFGDADVAASVVRVPSVTIQDSKFVFIRGLGGRYITTTLNGAAMPSTDPAKRTVPLDLFPSNIVEQLDVKKTFVASMPGESTGGNLVINTRTFPDQRSGKLSISIAGTDGLTGESVLSDPIDGDYDWLGWDAGEREESGAISTIAEVLSLGSIPDESNGTTFELPDSVQTELQRVGAVLLKDDLDLDTTTANPDITIGANYGDLFSFDNGDLGVFAAVNYKNSWSQKQDGIDNTYTPGGSQKDILKFVEYANDIDVSGLLSLGLSIDEHTFESTTIVSRSTQNKVRRSVGQEGDEFQAQIEHDIAWIERQFISQQFSGSHYLNEDETLFVDWQITASQAKRLAPDRRTVTFTADSALTDPQSLLSSYNLDETDSNKQSVALNGFDLEVNALTRRHDDLVDDNLDFSSDFKYDIFSDASLNFGLQLIHRERDADSSTYGIVANPANIDFATDNLLVGEVITEERITGDPNTGFAFSEETFPSDQYEAELDLNSIYISYDHLLDSTYQFVAGVRYEDYEQTTETFAVSTDVNGNPVPINSPPLDEEAVLPSLAFNWFYRDDQQVRFAVSKTVSRPDFKETANALFFDEADNVLVRGNPFLDVSDVINYDARWEWYYGDQDDESVSVAIFYKDIDNAIERVVQPASGTASNARTFRNADTAEIYGIEFEGRKDFALSSDLTRSMFVILNAAVIESDVTLNDGSGSRELQGQPEYTFNLIFGYDDIKRGQELTLLLNQNGETIVDVGINGLPDIIEEPRLDINLKYKYEISDGLIVKASVENLLDEEVESTQGGRVFQSYKEGVKFKLGLDWNF